MSVSRYLLAVCVIWAAILVDGSPALSADDAIATADVNMRAGPSTSYPVVTVVPDGAFVLVHGCVEGYRWCDTSWRGHRGFIHSAYLDAVYQSRRIPFHDYGPINGVPLIVYRHQFYWYDHYRSRLFYDDTGLYNPLESYRDEYGSSYYHQHR